MNLDEKPVKIVFLAHVISNPRVQRRARILESMGAEIEVLGFERGVYAGKKVAKTYISLGQIQHGQYHKRLVTFAKAFPIIRRLAAGADVIYTFGADLLFLSVLVKLSLGNAINVTCEIADIENKLVENTPSGRLFRLLERFLIPRSDLLIVTSEAYVTEYYRKIQGLPKIFHQVIENKVEKEVVFRPPDFPTKRKPDGVLRIGLFGMIRHKSAWEALMRILVAGRGRIRLYLRGMPLDLESFASDVRDNPHVIYKGTYVVPDDLPEMYAETDMIWLAHGIEKKNMLWNRANRFYQACYYGKPMIAQKGTQDGKVVGSRGLGLIVDLEDGKETVDRVLSISENDLESWREKIEKLPEKVYCYTDEHEKLMETIRQKRDGGRIPI